MGEDIALSAKKRNAPKLPSFVQAHNFCLDNARGILSAARTIFDAHGPANVCFHLCILALEEIGKAGMIFAQGAARRAGEDDWVGRKLDDHIWKLQWALWSPHMASGRISPKDFEEARDLAKRLHAERLESLYVDFADNLAAPNDKISRRRAEVILQLADARLQLESERKEYSEPDENLKWFLESTENDDLRRRIFSKEFIDKHAELKGDTRAWVTWMRKRIKELQEESESYTREQISKQGAKGLSKKKWKIKIKLVTQSLTVRDKVLNVWNERFPDLELRAGSRDKKEISLNLTLYDNVTVNDVWNAGLSISMRVILALNIATWNFVWFDFPKQMTRFFESIKDLEAPHMEVQLDRTPSLSTAMKQGALRADHLNMATECLIVFSRLREATAKSLFEPYFEGLKVLAKNDIHIDTSHQARGAFDRAMRAAAKRYCRWNGSQKTLVASIRRKIAPLVSTEEAREHLLKIAEPSWNSVEGKLIDALHSKLICDLILCQGVREEFRKLIERQ